MYAESQPVRFSDRDMFPLLIDTVTRVAKFIGKKIEACQELVNGVKFFFFFCK